MLGGGSVRQRVEDDILNQGGQISTKDARPTDLSPVFVEVRSVTKTRFVVVGSG
ncbi:hypothetical protein M8C21_006511 [Ambrosia artemisiifolia]|uniref:Uncharacterized protein n=1 Tax=Ambrosia artemisiifolia TaxID=4212 RepID=A0AAD5G238_AMBAR|nr:hypothetical protein M8C21_006511 [Ambrosia artemisiifolia]